MGGKHISDDFKEHLLFPKWSSSENVNEIFIAWQLKCLILKLRSQVKYDHLITQMVELNLPYKEFTLTALKKDFNIVSNFFMVHQPAPT